MKRYAVYGVDGSFRYLWVACLVAGIKAAKERYALSKSGVDTKTTSYDMLNASTKEKDK